MKYSPNIWLNTVRIIHVVMVLLAGFTGTLSWVSFKQTGSVALSTLLPLIFFMLMLLVVRGLAIQKKNAAIQDLTHQ